jgi:hypothetical protein
MTTDPLVRRFNPAGPNYGQSGLDTPVRKQERQWAHDELLPVATMCRRFNMPGRSDGVVDTMFGPVKIDLPKRGAVSLGGSAPRAASEV